VTSALQAAVASACEGSPYVVTTTDSGFDVALDLVNARWHGLFRQHRLRESYVHHVTVDEPNRTYLIVDDCVRVRRTDLGHGTYSFAVAGSARRQRGTVITWQYRSSFGLTEDPSKPLSIGGFGEITNYTFSSEESRRLITGPAAELGYDKKMDPVTRTGLVIGLIGASSVVLVPLGLLIRHLVG
jgi:hypothetical protein